MASALRPARVAASTTRPTMIQRYGALIVCSFPSAELRPDGDAHGGGDGHFPVLPAVDGRDGHAERLGQSRLRPAAPYAKLDQLGAAHGVNSFNIRWACPIWPPVRQRIRSTTRTPASFTRRCRSSVGPSSLMASCSARNSFTASTQASIFLSVR